ncbi:MAG TPA: tRNA (adenosine(37)-N6)-dimethylallyltransferase MiaA [Gammaproteobacteria bacterium]|nr:tRNA (adenosine(37)-N6)-dimethylallyltransferase MiaA [Gammaproteobacteria bacterium]
MNATSASNGEAALPPAILLMGPTATGKSDAALALADRLPVEIVSVDSAMIYRGMDIGTAKPSAAERDAVPHHLIDILDPEQSYSAAQFRSNALAAMADITTRGSVPLLVGGTLLYFRALTRGLAPLPEADPVFRAEIEQEAARSGWPALHSRLAEVDPDAAARIHPNDAQRIQRALEVHRLTGKPISRHFQQHHEPPPYRLLRLALMPASRALLHERIAARFEAMVAAGFISEVAVLRDRPNLTAEHPSMRAVGYRQLWAYLDGRRSREQAIADGIVATRRYAKRQITWLRSELDIRHLDAEAGDLVDRLISEVREFIPH